MDHSSIRHTLTSIALAAALCLATASRSAADERTRCQRRVEGAERHYRHEVQRHGKHSRQAEQAKAKLNARWNHCWLEAHAWYDPHRREWRTDRDWERSYDWDR